MCFRKAIKGVKTHACTSNFTQYSKKNDHVLFTYESNHSKHEINCLSKNVLCQFCHKMGIRGVIKKFVDCRYKIETP